MDRGALEGKAVSGVSDAALIDVIKDLGGGTADGGPWEGDALHADGPTFDRACELVFEEAAPETDAECAALERFKNPALSTNPEPQGAVP